MSSPPKRPTRSSQARKPTAPDGVSITGRRRKLVGGIERSSGRDGADGRLETYEQSAERRPQDSPDTSAAGLAGRTAGREDATDEP